MPEQIENLMKPAVIEEGAVVDGPWQWVNPIYWPPGGLVSTAEDLTRFMLMVLGDAGENQLLSDDSLAMMLTPQEIKGSGVIADWIPFLRPRGTLLAFSPGWILHDYQGRLVCEHTGAGTASTTLAIVPEEKLGVFVATNATYSTRSDRMVSALKFTAIDHFLDLPPTDWITLLD